MKVFKTTLNKFKNRDRYIKDDYRFKARFSKQNPRKVVRMWAEKEMHNLKRFVVYAVSDVYVHVHTCRGVLCCLVFKSVFRNSLREC